MNEGRLFEKMTQVVRYVRDMDNRLISWQQSSVHFTFIFDNIISSCPISTTVPKIVSLLLLRNIRIKMANLILKIVWLYEQCNIHRMPQGLISERVRLSMCICMFMCVYVCVNIRNFFVCLCGRDLSKFNKHCLLHASCSFLVWLILRSWIWKRLVLPKRHLTFRRLHGVIAEKIVLSITTAEKTKHPRNVLPKKT
jgi:hypothetical protein